MQQPQCMVERPFGCRLHFSFCSNVIALQHGLGKFDIPVAKIIPDELINPIGSIIKPISFYSLRHGVLRLHGFADNPARQRQAGFSGIEITGLETAIHFAKARGVPQFCAEIAIALDARFGQLDIAPHRRHRRQRETQGVRSIFVAQVQRVDYIALGLRHFRAFFIAHQRVNINRVERHIVHEVQAAHHHARNPEENNIEACNQYIRFVMPLEFRRFLRPTQR